MPGARQMGGHRQIPPTWSSGPNTGAGKGTKMTSFSFYMTLTIILRAKQVLRLEVEEETFTLFRAGTFLSHQLILTFKVSVLSPTFR